ncbi:ABC transporter substrate-binding protein [Candidatus Poribacteria bacterium]|nr:ABC transporter substrate-binding protein [Candidatus Poribacteria bacterium]
MKNGYDLALDEVNEAQIANTQFKFIYEDNTSTPEGAVEDFNKLIHEDGVSVIIGPASSSATAAAFPVARDNQIVAISSTSGSRGLGAISDYVFRVPLTTDVVAPIGVKRTHAKLKYQRVATLYDKNDVFSSDREDALQQAFTEYNIEALTPETFQSGDIVFTEQLTRIKEGNPDVVFVSALPPEKPGILIQARELGISVPIIITSLTDVEVQAAGDAAEGAITFIGWLPTDDTPGNHAFVQKYTDTFGMEPNAFATASYSTVYILAEAIKNANATDSTAIRDALANIKDFDTVFGKFSFNADGDAVYEPKALIVQDGTLQPFE